MKRHITSAIVFAAFAGLMPGQRASASFDYSTAVTFNGGTPGGVTSSPITLDIVVGGVSRTETGIAVKFGGTEVDFLGASRTGFSVPGTDTLDFVTVRIISSTTPPPSDSFSFNYSVGITLTNNGPPGTNASILIPFTGTFTGTGVNTGNGTFTNTFTSPTSGSVILGGVLFTGALEAYSPATVNGSLGSLGGSVVASVVPEPASIAMLGMGLASVGLAAHRRFRSGR
jgi:hypothetical protein